MIKREIAVSAMLVLVAAGAWLIAAAPASAETFRVVGQTDMTGLCNGTDCASIRQALAAAGSSPGADRIEIPAGDYRLTQGRLDVDSEVTVVGAGARSTIIRVDPQFPDRVFLINAVAAATISHLTMRDGAPDADGGNLLNAGGTVVLDHVRVTGGDGSSGGGLANHNGVMTVRQSLIDTNTASEAGGISNFGGNGLPGRLTVSDTTIASNRAVRAGALSSDGNSANTTTLDRVTVVRNVAIDGTPGGLLNDPINGGTIRIHGSIVSANTAPSTEDNCGGTPPISEGGNVSSGSDCSLTGPADLQGVDPQLSAAPVSAPGETDAYAIAATSPALDRFACVGVDQLDITRPQGSACDAGAYELDQLPDTVLGGDASGFTFSSPEPGVTFECALDGITAFAACASPYAPGGLAPGTYTLLVRAVDAAGRRDASPAARTFVVAAAPPAPTPTPTPTPTPVAGRSVLAEPVKGKVLVKLKGTTRFVPLDASVIENGAEVDTRKGTVEITRSDGGKAEFFAGIFKLSQSGGMTTLTLTEKLAPCPSKRARIAASKPKTRKLWGDGKGKFRTKGQYGAATVRGTKWLVQDGCRYTRFRVAAGSVNVRDEVKKKTIILRRGKTYTARPRR